MEKKSSSGFFGGILLKNTPKKSRTRFFLHFLFLKELLYFFCLLKFKILKFIYIITSSLMFKLDIMALKKSSASSLLNIYLKTIFTRFLLQSIYKFYKLIFYMSNLYAILIVLELSLQILFLSLQFCHLIPLIFLIIFSFL